MTRGVAARAGERSNQELLRAAKAGSRAAVEELLDRHWDKAHRIAYGITGDRHGAEDVTQEALLSVVANLRRVDPYRPFAPWFHRVVANRALDWGRARSRRNEISDSGLAETEAAAAPCSDPDLVAALVSLTPEQRAIVILRFVGGYGPKEVARMLKIPTGTVGSRLRRALDQMRDEMEAGDE